MNYWITYCILCLFAQVIFARPAGDMGTFLAIYIKFLLWPIFMIFYLCFYLYHRKRLKYLRHRWFSVALVKYWHFLTTDAEDNTGMN